MAEPVGFKLQLKGTTVRGIVSLSTDTERAVIEVDTACIIKKLVILKQ